MRLFNALALEITSSCNRRCKFCPVSYSPRKHERLPWHLIEKACEELVVLRFKGRLALCIYNEPLKDKDYLLEVLEYFKKKAPRITLMVATNGDYLTGARGINELFDAGLNQLMLNGYTKKRFKMLSGWAAKVPKLGAYNIYGTTPRCARNLVVCDKSDISKLTRGLLRFQNRAGAVPGFLPPMKSPLKKMCVKPFRMLNINWEGQGVLCCNDYYGEVVLGNFFEKSLEQIWDSPILNMYRKALLEKDRSLPLCCYCDSVVGAYPHLVDTNFGKASDPRLYRKRTKV